MKDENLKIARENGINVPEFVCLKFEEIFDGASQIESRLEHENFDDLSSLSKDLKAIALNCSKSTFTIPLQGQSFAVRSACSVEDGVNTSFAGQFETYLNVSRESIHSKVGDCISSLYNENVLKYAMDNGIDVKTLRMNVVIQNMLNPSLAGVLFTANPQGILNESVIVVGKGLGDAIVSDKAETTSYYYNLTDKIYYFDGKENLLTDERIDEIIELSEKLKKIYANEHLDVEFAFENDSLYVLQIRPITMLDSSNPTILDNSNIVESYPGISLPLTDSFVNLVYSGVFRGLASRVLKSERFVSKYDSTFENMVGSANGRMYYKISNWYTVIKFLPLNKKIIPIWQEMLGVKTKSYSAQKVEISAFRRICTYINAVYELLSVPRNMKKLEQTFNSINVEFYKKFEKDLSDKELVALFGEIRLKLLKVWDVTLLNDMYSFIFTGLVKSKLKKTNPDDYEQVSASFLSGISNIESMKPIRALAKLSKLRANEGESEEFKREYANYIQIYGDRYIEELKLESKTFRTNNELLDQRIEEYAQDSERIEKLLKVEDDSNNQGEKSSGHNLPKDKYGPFFSMSVNNAIKGISNREISRLNRSRIFGMVRGIFLRLGESFKQQGIIDDTRDIFYLKIDEVFGLVQDSGSVLTSASTSLSVSTSKDMKNVVKERKVEYERYFMFPAYSRLVFAGTEFNKENKYINAVPKHVMKGKLFGTACSNGVAKGEVLIVSDVRAVGDVKGKILVTKMTDPGWVFLLAGASGIVSEKGSILSHTAIVSRELGIPSVVGVDNVLNELKNGDIVTIDGGKGTVVLEE